MAKRQLPIKNVVFFVVIGLWLTIGYGFIAFDPNSAEEDYPRIEFSLLAARVEKFPGGLRNSDRYELALYTPDQDRFYIVRHAPSDAAIFLKDLHNGDELVVHHMSERHARGHEIVSLQSPRGDILPFEQHLAGERDMNYILRFFGLVSILTAVGIVLFHYKARGVSADAA